MHASKKVLLRNGFEITEFRDLHLHSTSFLSSTKLICIIFPFRKRKFLESLKITTVQCRAGHQQQHPTFKDTFDDIWWDLIAQGFIEQPHNFLCVYPSCPHWIYAKRFQCPVDSTWWRFIFTLYFHGITKLVIYIKYRLHCTPICMFYLFIALWLHSYPFGMAVRRVIIRNVCNRFAAYARKYY